MIRNGSITVVDLTDGTDSYLHIAWANDTSGTDFSTSDSTNKLYIGVYSDSNVTGSTDYTKYSWTRIKGEPGATGATGATGAQGTSVVKTETEYYKKVEGGAEPDSSTTGSTAIPNYTPGSTYYKRTVTYLSNNTSFKGNWIQDTGLTNEIKNAYDAWVAAGTAEQRTKKIITDSSGVTVAAGVNGADVTEGTTSTYGYNTIMAPNYLGLRYNDINLSKLTTTGLDFYIPTMNGTTPVQGNKGLELTSNAITFYNPNTDQAQLIIGANGTLQSGNYTRGSNSKFSSNGTKIDLINGDIITKYFRVSQGLETGLNAGVYVHGTIEALDGTIGTDSTNYWEIGNGTDYNLNSTAKMIGHGSSYIQLGDSSTWRLATNRVHTGWYITSDSLLHYPEISSKYWDFGLHTPTAATEKFLYIRKSKADTSASNVLTNLLYDIDDTYATPQWDYIFYVSADGSLYARNLYVLDENGNATQIGGTDGVYLLKSGGTMTGSITMSNGGKFIGDLTGNADSASNAAKVNGLTVQTAVPANAVFTDYRVKTEARGSTTMYLAGSNTTGTVSQGTLLTDSGVYVQTSNSSTNLVVPKVNGYTLAAASAKGVDEGTSMPASATDNNVPTTQLMKSFVEGKGYITSYTETDPTVPSWAKAPSKPSYELTEISGTNDIRAIEALTGTSGFLKKTAANTWTLDTNTYLTSHQSVTDNNPTLSWGTKSEVATIGSTKIYVTAMAKPTYSYSDLTSKPDPIVDATVDEDGIIIFTKNNGGTIPLSTDIAVIESEGANKLVDATHPNGINVGNGTTPIYFNGGIPTEANTYAGGTAVTLNNTSKASSTASFYAPISGGTAAQILVGNDTTGIPTWKAISDIVPSKASTADAFSSAATITLTGDTTGSASSTKGWSIATTTKTITPTSLSNVDLNNYKTVQKNEFYYGSGSNGCTNHPAVNGWQFGLYVYASAAGHVTQELSSFADSTSANHGKWIRWHNGSSWSAWEKLVTSTNYTDYTVKKDGTGASGTWGISITGTAAKATNDSDGNAINTTYLKKSGGTMTGVLNALANQYTDGYTGALNMNNSNIYGVNSIYTADLSDNSQEGIHFYRTSNTVDTIYAQNGVLYFVPNRTIGSNGTSYTVLHTGNYTSTLNDKYVTIDTAQTITAQKTFNTGTRWSVPNSASGSKYGAINYDANLDALVFSFGTI